jgi:hypothetical protein
LRGKLVHFPLNPLQSSRNPLVTKRGTNVNIRPNDKNSFT